MKQLVEFHRAISRLNGESSVSSDPIPEAQLNLRERMREEMKSQPLLPNLAAGLVMGIVSVTISTAFAALIFSGQLAGSISQGIGLMLAASIVTASLTAFFSSLKGVVVHLQESAVAILAVVSGTIVNQMPVSATGQEKFITVVVAIGLSSLLTGGMFLLLGQFKLGNLIRFIPYPVVGGFLAASGLLLALGAISLLTGATAGGIPLLSSFLEFGFWTRLLPGLVFAIILLVVLRQRKHALVVPVIVMAGIVSFYLFLEMTGVSIASAVEQGLLLGTSTATAGTLWQLPNPFDLVYVNWLVIRNQIGSLLFVAVVSVVAILLNATGIELATGQDADLNRDLRSAGVANLMAGVTGGMVGYHASSESALAYRMGARSRWLGLILAAVCGVTLALGGPVLAYLPRPVLGGLLLFLGFDILATWVYDVWFRLPITDCFVIVAILIAVNVVGILEGIGLGVVLGIILFVVDYSRIDIVKHVLTGATFHSNVNRPRQHEELLREEGGRVYILELHGFVFFGTAQKLVDMIRKRIHDSNLLPVSFLLMDFRLVNGVDSSAVLGLAKIRQLAESRGITTVLTHLSPKIQRQMKDALGKRDGSIQTFQDMDHGVEWCEDKIISTFESRAGSPKPRTLMRQLQEALPKSVQPQAVLEFFDEKKAEKGEYIIKQGRAPGGLYFIESGRVTVQLEGNDGKVTRLRTMQTGTVVGELGLYLGQTASASVIADEPCMLFYLSADSLKEMEEKAPDIAATFHKFIVEILSERLLDTNDTLQALIT